MSGAEFIGFMLVLAFGIWVINGLFTPNTKGDSPEKEKIDWWGTQPKSLKLDDLRHGRMHHKVFERLIVKVYENRGYHAFHTGDGSDDGKDVVATKPNEHLFVECKQGKQVDIKTVRAFSTTTRRGKATKGVIISVSGFSRDALREAERSRPRIECIYAEDILHEIREAQKS